MAPKPKTIVIHRDAGTGRIIKKSQADARLERSTREVRPAPVRGGKKK